MTGCAAVWAGIRPPPFSLPSFLFFTVRDKQRNIKEWLKKRHHFEDVARDLSAVFPHPNDASDRTLAINEFSG